MKTKILVSVLMASAMLSSAFAAVTSGSSEGTAISYAIGRTLNVPLVNEYDDAGGYYDMGARYLKVRLQKGQAYTIWISGGNTSQVDLDVYARFPTDAEMDRDIWGPMAWFDFAEYAGGATKAAFLYSDSWDSEDPSSWDYYIVLSGEIGHQVTLQSTTGIRTFVREGEQSLPRRITMKDGEQQKESHTLIDGEYYFVSALTAGRKYMLRTQGGTKENPLWLSIDGFNPAGSDEPVNVDFAWEPIPAYTNDPYNASYYVYPFTTADYIFDVSGTTDEGDFKLRFMAFPSRLPGEHPNVREISAATDYNVEVHPGRMLADETYYDEVIDEDLCKVRLPAGQRWVFDATKAEKPILMRVYDSAGNILGENATIGNGSFDTRVAIETAAADWYYVGVCDPTALTGDDRPVREAVTVQVASAESFTTMDNWDPADDEYTGASLVTPYPVQSVETLFTEGSAHGPHTFSGCDWYDWYEVPCRAGLTYAFRAKFCSGDDTSTLGLKAKVYRLEGDNLVKVGTSGTLTPENFVEALSPLSFTASLSGRYFIRVSVAEGVGLDYPPYEMHAVVFGEQELGLLQVKTKGVEGSWYLYDDSSAVYPNGAVLALPVGTAVNVRYTDVNGFVTPAKDKGKVIRAWTGSSEDDITRCTGLYYDIYDPGDDEQSGYFSIAPTSTKAKCKRTLWAAATNPFGADDKDYFRFKAAEGVYYSFWLTDKTQEGVGDAVMTITDKETGKEEFAGKTSVMKQRFDPGKYYICVSHALSPAADTSYWLSYHSANVGVLQFSKTTNYKASDTDAFVDVTVTRSGSEGVVQVNYATVEGTAVPGTDYYPASGVLRWEDGDSEPKTIRIRLIPDLRPVNTDVRKFTVKLWPMEERALEDDEYVATIAGSNEASVKISDPTAQDPGEVVLVGPRTVAPDSTPVYRLVRQGACQGRIAVKVKTKDGTALAGRDFSSFNKTFVWEDGESGENEKGPFALTINEAQDSAKEKQFRIKLEARTTDAYADCLTPDIPDANNSITIDNYLIDKTFEQVQAEVNEAGVWIPVPTGTWYADKNYGGAFRCDPPAAGAHAKVKFKVNGSGFLILEPELLEGVGTFRYQINESAWTVCSSDRLVLPIKAAEGVQTVVVFKLKDTDGNAFAAFKKQDNGLPVKWLPISSVKPVDPMDNAVVNPMQAKLVWTAPSGGAETESIWYRVRTKGVRATKQTKCKTVLTNGTEKTACDIPAGLLTAGQDFAWVLDYAISDDPDPDFDSLDWVTGQTVWNFSVAVVGAAVTQCTSLDARGNNIKAGEPVVLVQGVFARITFDDSNGSGVSLIHVGGELPPGVEMKEKATKKRLKGVPTTPGDYTALFRVDGAVPGETLPLTFHVVPLGTGLGSFNGTLKEDGTVLTNGYPRIGRLTFSAAADGTISAKAKVGDSTIKFSSTDGYDQLLDWKEDAQTNNEVTVTLESETVVNGVSYPNTLTVTIDAGGFDDPAALGRVGKANLVLSIADANGLGAQTDIAYACDLYRTTTENEDYVKTLAKFGGYYTMALVPFGVQTDDGVPCGNGYLTATVSEAGEVLFAGRLADGTEYSASASAQLVGDVTDPHTCVLCAPLAVRANPSCFGGVIKIRYLEPEDADGIVRSTVDSLEGLEWCKDGKYSSYDRKGFRFSVDNGRPVQPTGGWYDTVVNLQRYYLYRDFTAEAEPMDGLPQELVPSGYNLAVATPFGVGASFTGNTLAAEARKLVPDPDDPTRYDLDASVNPWKVKTSLDRATGVITGTFKAWGIDANYNPVEFATYNHYGIVLMNRDEKTSPLVDDPYVLSAGFYLAPVTSKWTLSLPFNILWTQNDRNGWQETEAPIVEE